MNPKIIIAIYIIGFFVTFYIGCFTVSRKEQAGKTKEADEEAESIFPVAMFWPVLVVFAIVALPFLLLKWVAEKHSKSL